MGSKGVASVNLLLILNLILFSMVSSDTTVAPPPAQECPELGLCVNNVLGIIGSPSPSAQCCSLLGGLLQINATVCICDKVRVNILGIPIVLDVDVIALVNLCNHNTTGIICN
ncbi:hypothetical protein Fmac_009356 [Flemingia macrophylla]|uniref:Hydrophobic seed protein domain-containing protein n=1 Tax=Flemingia macrophylla TaxID=520843 RepID=A0ABD1N0J7_9FABA